MKNEIWDMDDDLALTISKTFTEILKGFDCTIPGDDYGMNRFNGNLTKLQSLIKEAIEAHPECVFKLSVDGVKDEDYNGLEGSAFIGYWRPPSKEEADAAAQVAREKKAAQAAYRKQVLEAERKEYQRLKAKYEK